MTQVPDGAGHDKASLNLEWPTLSLIGACTVFIVLLLLAAHSLPTPLIIVLLATALTLHSSLQHEVIHGHPSRSQIFNETLVSIPFGIFIPYLRFRDLHLLHHLDERLTDPHDDPESNYLDPNKWQSLPWYLQRIFEFNNTLTGRMLIGPVIGLLCFYKGDMRALFQGDRAVGKAYVVHIAALIPWLWIIQAHTSLSVWAYALAAWLALSLLRVRTFLEHRAHQEVAARTAIVADRGLLAFLFLNNNLHVVHHRHPRAPWYRLPELYRTGANRYHECNGGYVYKNYAAVFQKYLWRRKDPVPHPLVQLDAEAENQGTRGQSSGQAIR